MKGAGMKDEPGRPVKMRLPFTDEEYQAISGRHPQRRIRTSTPWGYRWRLTVDAGVAHLIQLVNRLGYPTIMSCQEHHWGWAWLLFPAGIGERFGDLLREIAPDVPTKVGVEREGWYPSDRWVDVFFPTSAIGQLESALAGVDIKVQAQDWSQHAND
jgi:hypothetical protein